MRYARFPSVPISPVKIILEAFDYHQLTVHDEKNTNGSH